MWQGSVLLVGDGLSSLVVGEDGGDQEKREGNRQLSVQGLRWGQVATKVFHKLSIVNVGWALFLFYVKSSSLLTNF